MVKNEIIKGSGVVALVVDFGWWIASDVPEELTFQLWLQISEKYRKPDYRPAVVALVAGGGFPQMFLRNLRFNFG